MSLASVEQEVSEAYADCYLESELEGNRRRNLRFKASESVSRDEAIRIMETYVMGYNNFEPSQISFLPEDSKIVIAREYSVCLYIEGDITNQVNSRNLQFQECDYKKEINQTRLWWD